MLERINEHRYYSDINLDFKPHPLTGDVTTLLNAQAVRRSLIHIGNMLPFDIPFNPDYHGHIRELLFEIPSETTRIALASRIKWVIGKMEPRAKIIDVKITIHNENQYHCQVLFSVLSLMGEYSTEFYLERLR